MVSLFNLHKSKLHTKEDIIRQSFQRVKEELSEHLDAINDNTNEIQANFEHMQELETKIDKLNEKFDKILHMLQGNTQQKETFQVEPLTLREQEVFIALYTKESSLSYQEISQRTGLPVDLIKSIIQSMIAKGVPIIKRYQEGDFVLEIDSEFKQTQTKKNILQLNEQIMQHMVYQN
ncbi:MAG: hypothetical protein ACMXYA_01290 [Candidatus Woesearchaeota archaeon]